MKRTMIFSLTLMLLVGMVMPVSAAGTPTYTQPSAQSPLVTPAFTIVDVLPRQSVTIMTAILARNDTITVTMGNYGTGGVGGTVVGTITSGAGGQVTATYNIPAALQDAYQIDLRLQSSASGLFSTNWFYNNSGSPYAPPPYPAPYPPGPYPEPRPQPQPQPPFPYPHPHPSGVTPTISIVSVVQDSTVTFQTFNFPPNRTFNVLMGPMGNMGVNGTLAGSFYSGSGGSMMETMPIPANLRGSHQIAIRTESTSGGYYSFDWFYNSSNNPYPPYPPYGNFSFSVLSVMRDTSVTIQTNNLPPNQTYTVRMGPAGTQAVNGTFVDTITSSTGGTLVLTFYIPANLRGSYQIDLRIESTYSGSSAYGTFYNDSSGPTPPPPYDTSFTVTNVIRDQSVSIQTYNFPAAVTYNVLMGYPGTDYQSGFSAGTMNSGPGGSFETTFTIPYNLRGADQIVLWIVNNATGQLLSQTFYNSSGGGSNAYSPSFTVTGVVRDSTVTIQTNNFPPNDTFNVRMGPMGSMGVNGTLVGSINSGTGGSFTATFNVPANLYGAYQIAIRLESTYTGYYAYNWFYNNSTGPGPFPGSATVTVNNVVQDQNVAISGYNFAPALTYNVLMGYAGTNYTAGILAGTVNSVNGTFSATIGIPPALFGASQIWLWVVDPVTNQLAATTSFYNSSSPGPNPPYPCCPTFTITGVVRDATVTIQTSNFPPNDTFNVRMGPMGGMGINGTLVGSINSGSGGSFTSTFNIPANLFGSNQIAMRLESPYSGYYAYNWFYNNSTGPGPYPGSPTVTVTSVVPSQSATVTLSGFPPAKIYDVLMGFPGTNYTAGIPAGSFNSDGGGSMTATFTIPAALSGASQLWLWVVDNATSQLTASTSFYNSSSPYPTPYGGVPTFTISSVVKDVSVTIVTNNFPVNDTYDVLMGPMGSQGIGGTKVGTFNSDGGGSFTATFNIPPNLAGSAQIAMRLQSPATGYYAYNWFYNNTTP